MRLRWLLLVSAGACASGSGAGQPDGGAGGAACATHAECDDGDSCTTDVCREGSCGVSAIDRCADSQPVLADDFESRPDRVVDDASLGGWEPSAGACPVGVEVRLDDHFDYGKPSAFVHGAGGWVFASAAGGTVSLVASPDDPAGYSMNVLGTTATGSYGQVMHQLSAQASGWAELRVRAPGTSKQKWFTLDERGSSRFYLYFDADGQVKYSSGGSKVSLRSYAADRWYRVRMSWDAGRDRVDLEIEGASHPDLPLHAPIERSIDRLRMRTAGASGLSFLVDDVAASGGENVKEGLASLRIGGADAPCEEAGGAARSFDPVRAGTLRIDLLATDASGPYLLELGEEGTPRGGVELAPDGTLRWRQGDATSPLPGSWRPGEWLALELRWDGGFDVWVGDDEAVSAAGLEPAQPIIRGLDELRVAVPPGGALWLDDVQLAAAR